MLMNLNLVKRGASLSYFLLPCPGYYVRARYPAKRELKRRPKKLEMDRE